MTDCPTTLSTRPQSLSPEPQPALRASLWRSSRTGCCRLPYSLLCKKRIGNKKSLLGLKELVLTLVLGLGDLCVSTRPEPRSALRAYLGRRWGLGRCRAPRVEAQAGDVRGQALRSWLPRQARPDAQPLHQARALQNTRHLQASHVTRLAGACPGWIMPAQTLGCRCAWVSSRVWQGLWIRVHLPPHAPGDSCLLSLSGAGLYE